MRRALLAAILLASCVATEEAREAPEEAPLTCDEAAELDSFRSDFLLAWYLDLIKTQGEIVELVQNSELGQSQERIDQANNDLETYIGEIWVLCECSDHVRDTPECFEWSEAMKQLFE